LSISDGHLTHAQRQNLHLLERACRENAEQLAAEADLMMEAWAHARAYFLALTGLEEMAKAQLAADLYAELIPEARFTRAFAAHHHKFAYLKRVVSGPPHDASSSIVFEPGKGVQLKKQRELALYVGMGAHF
jgi:AbiV family abortive infection protein